ncbi:rhodanese-like domain-containing protein [Fuchsiella alkaliacetigena]|uniref:rhodanese-like domain-containing protein n=1 Tax=Fuchsiella alkaliacetigena TaxID=957042 RepID=UPI00200B56B9|nr:rhodanese-like domain-containing protein [Fuchsiella alkaliacetigena]MCK8825076.1 hypothetical protein [Fuchsiella alkaliacetigena]
MKKGVFLVVVLLSMSLLLMACGTGGDYQYYSAEELKDSLEGGESLILLDIQVEEEFEEHHIEGAIPTYAYPAQSEEDLAKLDSVLPDLESSQDPIIVICPGGGGGATGTIDYLVEQGIAADRMYILEDGQSAWPYPELLAN